MKILINRIRLYKGCRISFLKLANFFFFNSLLLDAVLIGKNSFGQFQQVKTFRLASAGCDECVAKNIQFRPNELLDITGEDRR